MKKFNNKNNLDNNIEIVENNNVNIETTNPVINEFKYNKNIKNIKFINKNTFLISYKNSEWKDYFLILNQVMWWIII